jgi:hypothetical protein
MNRLERKKALASLSEAEKLVNAIKDAMRFPRGPIKECPVCHFTFRVGGHKKYKKYCSARCKKEAERIAIASYEKYNARPKPEWARDQIIQYGLRKRQPPLHSS